MKKFIIFAITVVLPSCATTYEQAARSQYIGNGMYEISSDGNGYTHTDTVRRYLYRKAFETCANEGLGFSIYGNEDTSSKRLTGAHTDTYGNTNFYSANFPGGRALVKCEGKVDERMAKELGYRKLASDSYSIDPEKSGEPNGILDKLLK